MSQSENSNKKMFKFKPSDIFIGLLLTLMIIPRARSFIQQNLHKAIGIINPPVAIESSKQKNIKSFKGQLKSINRDNDINFKNLEGKIILINFWATWCPPCVAEMPSLESLYNTYKDNVVFLFITDDTAQVTNKFLQDRNYTMPCYNLVDSLPEELNHNTYPTTFLIDTKGNIVVNKSSGADWDGKHMKTIINQLIKE